jgi:hypothetical protein
LRKRSAKNETGSGAGLLAQTAVGLEHSNAVHLCFLSFGASLIPLTAQETKEEFCHVAGPTSEVGLLKTRAETVFAFVCGAWMAELIRVAHYSEHQKKKERELREGVQERGRFQCAFSKRIEIQKSRQYKP